MYDGDGYRVGTSFQGLLTHFYWDGDQISLETDASDQQIARNVYGLERIARILGPGSAAYALLSDQQRVPPKADGLVQSHHPIQDKWAQLDVPGYNRNEVPAILLKSSSGSSHVQISAAQRLRRSLKGYSTGIQYEFNQGYREMIDAGVPQNEARKVIGKAYKYFDILGAFQ